MRVPGVTGQALLKPRCCDRGRQEWGPQEDWLTGPWRPHRGRCRCHGQGGPPCCVPFRTQSSPVSAVGPVSQTREAGFRGSTRWEAASPASLSGPAP